jgi:TrmH RNA methyltransferase
MANKQKEDRIFGDKAVLAFFDRRSDDLIRLFVRNGEQGRYKKILSDCASKKKVYRLITDDELEKVSQSTHHEGICAIVEPKSNTPLVSLIEDYQENYKWEPLIVLDSVSNPHNIGGIIRSAIFFGITRIILNNSSNINLAGSLARISEGAVEHAMIAQSSNTKNLIELLNKREIQIISTDVHSENKKINTNMIKRPFALVLGNENMGISKDFRENSDFLLKLSGSGKIESLNVSVFAGVVFSQFSS